MELGVMSSLSDAGGGPGAVWLFLRAPKAIDDDHLAALIAFYWSKPRGSLVGVGKGP